MKHYLRIICLFLLCFAISCGGNNEKKTTNTQKKSDSGGSKSKKIAPNSSNVTVGVASWEQTLELVKKNKGKVVVVDVWSTNCPPCMKEFPHLIELHHKYKDKGNVVCISVSLDNDGTLEGGAKNKELQEKVLEFLREQKAEIQNFICSETDEEFYTKQKPELGAIPAVFVFAKDGTLKERFDDTDTKRLGGAFTYAKHIFPMVAELVK